MIARQPGQSIVSRDNFLFDSNVFPANFALLKLP